MAKRNHSTRLVRPVQTLIMGAFLLSPVAYAQGISATAKSNTATAVTQDDMKVMREQIQALAARVKQLEGQANQASSDSGDDKQSKSIERRLEALEHEQANHDARAKAGDKPGQLTTVVAPFTVVDKLGKPIVRIGASDSNSLGGISVFDAKGQAIVQLGMTRWGGLLSLMTSGANNPDVLLGVGSEGAKFQLQEGGKKQFVLDKESLAFYGNGDSVLSLFGTKKRVKGYLELNDSNGIMVEAGALDSHKGYVMANPWRPSPDVRGDPSVLKGGGK